MLSQFDKNNWRLFYEDRPTLLYYVKFIYKKIPYYKIGITTKTLEQRFANEKRKFEVIAVKQYDNGRDAYINEQAILDEYFDYRYWGKRFLKSGSSELFTEDVLKGDL